jgi:dUTP pyrophosphatase
MMKIQLIKNTNNELPKYETIESAGCDLRAELSLINEDLLFNAWLLHPSKDESVLKIAPGGRALIPTGLKMALPSGYEGMVRPRSGLALKHGITVLNTPGTIDSDYRGDVGVVLINHGDKTFTVNQGDRIAQLIINKVEQVEFEVVNELDDTARGAGGFGSTNVR